jgi:predicted O-methyltransferase YrrM
MTRILSLYECLLTNQSYFGTQYSVRQGDISRHKYFKPTADYICENFKEPIRILEIGSWAGASTISWAKAFISRGINFEITCIDHWMPYLDLTLNNNLHYINMDIAANSNIIYNIFQHNIKCEVVEKNVKVVIGSSKYILPGLNKEFYHLIYIDGSHNYNDVLSDLRFSKELIIPGGVICGDDLESQFSELNSQEIELLNDSMNKDFYQTETFSCHPGVTKAVFDELGEVQSWDGYWGVVWDRAKQILPLNLNNLAIPTHLDFKDLDKSQLEQADDLYKFIRNWFRINPYEVILIHQGIFGYNIVMYNNQFIAAPQSMGPINFTQPNALSSPLIIIDNYFSSLIEKIVKVKH